MTIKQTQPPPTNPILGADGKPTGEKVEQKPLLNINLPAPKSGDPNAPLPVRQHNACAQKNFNQVANIMLMIINNQKIMGLAITKQDKQVKELQENSKKIADNIRKLIKEEDKNDPNTANA